MPFKRKITSASNGTSSKKRKISMIIDTQAQKDAINQVSKQFSNGFKDINTLIYELAKILPYITTMTLSKSVRKSCKNGNIKLKKGFAHKALKRNQFVTEIHKEIYRSNIFHQEQQSNKAKQLQLDIYDDKSEDSDIDRPLESKQPPSTSIKQTILQTAKEQHINQNEKYMSSSDDDYVPKSTSSSLTTNNKALRNNRKFPKRSSPSTTNNNTHSSILNEIY